MLLILNETLFEAKWEFYDFSPREIEKSRTKNRPFLTSKWEFRPKMSKYNETHFDLVYQIYDYLYLKLLNLTEYFVNTNHIKSDINLGLVPAPLISTIELNKIVQVNKVSNSSALRIDVNTPLLQIRVKYLYNEMQNQCVMNIIDFKIEKIQLRCGGFGSNVIQILYELGKIQTNDFIQKCITTKITVFKAISLPFQFKNNFKFKQMVENNDGQNNDQNTTYKFFKMIIIMNKYQSINQFIRNIDLFSMKSDYIDDLLRRQIMVFCDTKYNDNLWIKEKLIRHVVKQCCGDFETSNSDISTKIIYTNIGNQITNERLYEIGILQILQELFYLENIY